MENSTVSKLVIEAIAEGHGEQPMESRVFNGDTFTQPHRIILHKSDNGWATHMENMQNGKYGYESKSPRDLYWGHYFGTYAEALADYGTRRLKFNTYQ